jgi:crotonobetainyl-CoA:carnitine CoA-transferase CaiB-like acyl-CoA transferase
MTDGILAGVRVLDLSDGIAAPVATMLLAEAGADVVKIEPPGGSAARSEPGFRTWNRSKRSVALDLDDPTGRRRFDELLGAADVLVHPYGPTRARELGLDDETLHDRFPSMVVSSVLSWPANHAAADLPADELLAAARFGLCDEQQGYRDGPIFVRAPVGSWCSAYLAAAGIVARLIARARDGGRGGPAHTSLVQGMMVPMTMHWSRAETPSPALAAGMPKGTPASLFECGDGVWVHIMHSPDSPLMDEVLTELGGGDLSDTDPSGDGQPAANRMPVDFDRTSEAFLRRTSQEWLENFWANDVPAQPALAPGEIFADAQARENRYVVELDDPEVGRITTAGMPLTVDPPTSIRGPAPAAGADEAAVFAEWKAAAREARPATRTDRGTRRWPLEGVHVLDLGNFLAGPYAPQLLADLGADVIKLESTAGDQMRYVEWAFCGCQRGKRSVAVDLKSPSAASVLDALVEWADIVHHNVRMPAARRLGIDGDTLRARKPELIFCHTSSYGPVGPRADWPGYDQLFQSSCGWEVAGAGEGNPPMWHRFGFMDHLCALSSLVATLLALHHRDRTGTGQAVAGSLLGAGVLSCSETYVGADGELAPLPVLDHAQKRTAPGYEITEVRDGWIAIAARTDEHQAALCAASGADLAGAAAAFADRTVAEALAVLSEAGVPAEQVRLDQKESFFDDPENQKAGLVARYRHSAFGMMEQPGSSWYFGDLDARLELAPPGLGEHTIDVLTEVGLSPDAIDALLADGTAKAATR